MYEIMMATTLILMAIALFAQEWNEPPVEPPPVWEMAGMAVRFSLIATLVVLSLLVVIAYLTLLSNLA